MHYYMTLIIIFTYPNYLNNLVILKALNDFTNLIVLMAFKLIDKFIKTIN